MHKSGNPYSKIKQENSNGFPLFYCEHLLSLSALPEIAEIALHQFGFLTQRKKASAKVSWLSLVKGPAMGVTDKLMHLAAGIDRVRKWMEWEMAGQNSPPSRNKGLEWLSQNTCIGQETHKWAGTRQINEDSGVWDPRINLRFLLSFLPSSLPIHPPIVTETYKRKWISGTRSGEEDALLAASCYAWLELDGHTWPSKQALFIHLLPHSGEFLSPSLPPPCLLAACQGRVEKRPQCCVEQAVAALREATFCCWHMKQSIHHHLSTGWAFPSPVLLVHRCGCCS